MNGRSLPLVLAVFVWALTTTQVIASESAGDYAHYKPNEVLVRFRPACSDSDRASVRAEMHGSLVHRLSRIGVDHIRLLGDGVEATIGRFARHPMIEFIEPNYRMQIAALPNDSLIGQLWNMQNIGQGGGTPLADIRVSPVWDTFTGDSAIKVGVLDAGVNYNHPDLINNIWTNPDDPTIDNVDDDDNALIDDTHGFNFRDEYPPAGPPDYVEGNGIYDGNDSIPATDDSDGHGTHVAGIIAGRGNNGIGISGVCWRAEVISLKVFTTHGYSHVDALAAALAYAKDKGCRVVNASLSMPNYSQTLRNAIEDACGSGAGGMLLVAAAGNSNSDNDVLPSYPASYSLDRVIAVSGTDRDDQLGFTNATYASNYGATSVDLAAPGWGILSTVNPSSYYALKSGTSMAAPHVVGVAALIMGANPSMNPDDVKARLLAGVDVLPSLDGKVLTSGRLNAYKAFYGLTDGVPPAAIDELSIEVGYSAIAAHWTNTGDDSATGTATAFDLRYSGAPITAGNFYSATPVATSEPDASGTEHCEFIGSLSACQTYYVAVKARDEAYNWSAISNVVNGATSCSPVSEPACGIQRQFSAGAVPRGDPGADGTIERPFVFVFGANDGMPRVIHCGMPKRNAGQTFELAVFDLAGRRVRTLAQGVAAPGRFETQWDLKSDDGRTVPRGLCFIRLRVGGTSVTQKVMQAH
jgi:subtilisin family serine protease